MTKAVIYARVSTGGQTTDQQLMVCREFCQKKGWDVVHEVVDDAVSGGTFWEQRANLKKVIDRGTTYDYLVVVNHDRLTRLGAAEFRAILHYLTHYGADLVSVGEPWLDLSHPLVRNIIIDVFTAMSKEERDKISLRTKHKYQVKKAHAAALGKKVKWGREGKLEPRHKSWLRDYRVGHPEDGYRAIATLFNKHFADEDITISYQTVRRVILGATK